MKIDHRSPWVAGLAWLVMAVAVAPACKQYRVADSDGSTDGTDAVATGGSTGAGGTAGSGGTAGVTGAGGALGTGGTAGVTGTGGGNAGTGGSGVGGTADGGIGTDGAIGTGGSGCTARNLTGLTSVVNTTAFSPDMQFLASGDNGGVVKIWKLSDGSSPTSVVDAGHQIFRIAYSRDGALLAVLSYDPSVATPYDPGAQTIKIWRTSDWSLVKTLDGRAVHVLKFGPDGHSLIAAPVVFGTADAGVIQSAVANIWDTSTWSLRTVSNAQDTDGVLDLAISPDGRFMVTAGGDSNLSRWGFDGSLIGTSTGPLSTSVIQEVDISPDSTTIATAGIDNSQVDLWNLSDGTYLKSLYYNLGISSVAFLRDGTTILAEAASSGDITTTLIANGLTTPYPGHSGAFTLAPDSNLIATPQGASIQLWCLQP